jgi:endonuclease/exonuclease/phosphatase family metal-dependent hydrolase
LTSLRLTSRASLLASICLVLAGAVPLEAKDPCVTWLPVAHSASQTAAVQTAKDPDTFAVASLNMAGQSRIADVLMEWTHQRTLDVLLLQEVGEKSNDGARFAADLAERLGFHVAYAPANRLGDTKSTQGLAIVSRYPLGDVRVDLLKYKALRFKSKCRIALSATVETSSGPVRLVNVHLDTRINSGARVEQLAPVLDGLKGTNGPQIIGGDMNTANIGWFQSMYPLPLLQRQVAAVRALFTRNGFDSPFTSTPSTFKFLGFPLKLDWLYLKHLKPVEYDVDHVRFSDHRGIWAHLKSDRVPSVNVQ